MNLWRRARPTPPSANGASCGARAASCGACAAFVDDAAAIEAALPGLPALSSGFGTVRGQDGLCLVHDRFVGARSSCGAFRPRPEPRIPSGRP